MLSIRKTIWLLFVSVLISNCGSVAISTEDIESTADQLAATRVALTLTAMPTNTSLPTSTPQPSSTFTPQPSQTATETATPSPRVLITWAPYGEPDSGAFATARADKSTGDTPMLLQNLTEERIQFILIAPQYQEYVFTNSLGLVLPQGEYSYRAWIGEKGPFSGSFVLNNADKHVLKFYPNKIHFSTP